MKKSTRIFFASFAITCILILAVCGFVAVDLSTDRYMPNQFGTFFEISSIKNGAVEFNFLEADYLLDTSVLSDVEAALQKFRGLVPALPKICARLAKGATELGTDALAQIMSADETY